MATYVRHSYEPSRKGESLERLKRTTHRQEQAQEVLRNDEQVMRA